MGADWVSRERVVGGSERVMVRGVPGHREEFGVFWKPLRMGVHMMISDPSGCCVAAELPVKRPPK